MEGLGNYTNFYQGQNQLCLSLQCQTRRFPRITPAVKISTFACNYFGHNELFAWTLEALQGNRGLVFFVPSIEGQESRNRLRCGQVITGEALCVTK